MLSFHMSKLCKIFINVANVPKVFQNYTNFVKEILDFHVTYNWRRSPLQHCKNIINIY